MKFYRISDNTLYAKGYPWAFSIIGERKNDTCNICGGVDSSPIGNIELKLEPQKGTKWPDILGCGSNPLLIISQQVLNVIKNKA